MTPSLSSGQSKDLAGCLLLLGLVLVSSVSCFSQENNLPVDRKGLEKLGEKTALESGVTNYLDSAQVRAVVRGGSKEGLQVDFSHVKELTNGTKIDPSKIYGVIYAGPYPFEDSETGFKYRRYRVGASIVKGKAVLGVGSLLNPPLNSEGWTDAGQLGVSFTIFSIEEGKDRRLGSYTTMLAFRKKGELYLRVPALVEGPLVNLASSDDPGSVTVSFISEEKVKGKVIVSGAKAGKLVFEDSEALLQHEILLKGLQPATTYRYRVQVGDFLSPSAELRTAPPKGFESVRFAYLGDTRAGYGGGLKSHMGVNFSTVERLCSIAYSKGAQYLAVGGDLVNGYTAVPGDFDLQLHAWKQAVAGFWGQRPVYAAMGNHEALMRVFKDDSQYGVEVDRWPYETQSAEAAFARCFAHPRNGPEVSDPRRPTYKENVYSFQYGAVKNIVFNNNYWMSNQSKLYGGSPEGYLLDDQLKWIEAELKSAELDPSVQYVFLIAQEPVFPNGGHLKDGMWYFGDNHIRAAVFTDGKLAPEKEGMIEVRNRFVTMVSRHRKVAAVLGADEHAYHRLLVTREVPVGVLEKDDKDKSGKIDLDKKETCSPLPGLKFSTWFLVSGGGGAPFYAEEDAPWNSYWTSKKDPAERRRGFYYSSQENLLIIEASKTKVSAEVYNLHGELIDKVEDLLGSAGRR